MASNLRPGWFPPDSRGLAGAQRDAEGQTVLVLISSSKILSRSWYLRNVGSVPCGCIDEPMKT